MKKLSKAERIVIVVGTLIIIALLGLGLVKTMFIDSKKEPFTSKESAPVSTPTDTLDGITLKQDPFIAEAGVELAVDPATYLKADSSVLGKVSINFEGVDIKKTGTYTAKISYNGESMDLPIQVKDTTPPVISVANDQVYFTLEENSTLEELTTFVNASAKDSVDGVIKDITGWPKALPKEAGTLTYTLQAKDAAGNVGKKDIVVQYDVVKPVQ